MLTRKAKRMYETRPKKLFGGDIEVREFSVSKEMVVCDCVRQCIWEVFIYTERNPLLH